MKGKKLAYVIINWIAAALIVLLSVAVILFWYNSKHPIDNRTDFEKYYDSKCQSYAVQNFNLAKGQIVFIGDSITDLYVLDDHYSDLSLACYNRGIGGDTTSGVLRRLQVSAFDINPSKIVLMIGTNDINGGVKEADIISKYGQIIDSIYSALPQVELYCVSIIPQNDQIETYSSIKIDLTTPIILSLNSQIKRLSQSKGATYIDLFPLIADENSHLIYEYSDDGLHLNETGLSVWTALIKPYLQA